MTRLARSTAGMQATLRKRGWSDSEQMLASFRARILEVKQVYTNHLKEEILDHPMGQATLGVSYAKGIRLFRLLYYVDWSKCPSPAALWSFCGYGVRDGRSQYKARIIYSADTTWSTGASAAASPLRLSIMRNEKYNSIMQSRMKYEQEINFLPPLISKRRARRYTIKVYLRHLWVTGRTVYGLPLGEQHPDTPYTDLAEFGWDTSIRV